MPEVSVAALKETVENLSGAGATFRETASVHEEREGQMVWQGERYSSCTTPLYGRPHPRSAYGLDRR